MNFAGNKLDYHPPWWLKNGLIMTVYAALRASKTWQKTIQLKQPPYQAQIFNQADVPIFAWTAQPKNSCGTIIATYGITGELDNQWFLQILGRKAYAEGYDVILFDWRAHGKTAQLSPTLTSDGINEGKDFIAIAGEAKAKGFSPPFWLAGYSLGGQLALWGMYYSASDLALNLGLNENDIAGCGVICPNLDANRSLPYLINHPLGKYLEKAITKELKKLATKIHSYHPASIDLAALQRAESIAGFDRELVISSLGFPTVESYYQASSPLQFLATIKHPTFILYAMDDPLFAPEIIIDLQAECHKNPQLKLLLTSFGGHVGYVSSKTCQQQWGDNDQWWAWNRLLDFFRQTQ